MMSEIINRKQNEIYSRKEDFCVLSVFVYNCVMETILETLLLFVPTYDHKKSFIMVNSIHSS